MKYRTALEDALTGDRPPRKLTQREVKIMEHVVQGQNNKEIATVLGVSTDNIVRHIMHVRVKLHARGTTREQLIATYLATRET